MKQKIVLTFAVLFLLVLGRTQAAHAKEDLIEVPDAAMEDASDPSAFEGDSEAGTEERAPENMPMSDTPGAAGMSIE